MKLSPEELKHLEKRAKKDPVISNLVEWYKVMVQNPAYDSYVARLKILNAWNAELLAENSGKHFKLSGDDDGANKAQRYMEKQPGMVLDTVKLREMLTLDEANKAHEDPRLQEGPDLVYPTVEVLEAESNGRTADNRPDQAAST